MSSLLSANSATALTFQMHWNKKFYQYAILRKGALWRNIRAHSVRKFIEILIIVKCHHCQCYWFFLGPSFMSLYCILNIKTFFYNFSVDVDTLTAPAAIFWWILRWQIQVYCSENIMKGLQNTDNYFNFSHVWYICKIFLTQIRQDQNILLLKSTGRPSVLA